MSGIFGNINVSGAVKDLIAKLASGAVDAGTALIGFTQDGAGAVQRTARAKLLELRKTVFDFGAGPGAAQNTAAVLLASAAAKYPPELPVTAFDNRYGADVAHGAIAHNLTTGRVYNPRNQDARTFGQETLQAWFNRFRLASNQNTGDSTVRKMLIGGDSTTNGDGASYGTPQALLKDLAQARGYTNVEVINRGQSGKSTADWLATYITGDIAANVDLMVLRWGANDPFFGITIEQTIANLRAGLAQIRAGRGVAQLSIVLMTPSSMNDVEKGRTQAWSEKIGPAIRQAARDYQCAFIDTYGHFQNSHDGAGIWMDSDTSFYPGGRAIHPHDVLYEHICGQIADMVYPNWGTDWRANAVRNCSAGDVQTVKTGAELPASYFAGIGMHRMDDSTGSPAGGPFDGVAFTFKQADGAALQFSIPLIGGTRGSGISARIGFGNTWTDWYGQKRAGSALLANGWHNLGAPFAEFTYRLMMEGSVSLHGHIGIGAATADGTVIGTLPGGYRPAADEILLIGTETGTCRLRVGADGTLKIYGFGAGGNYIVLSGANFPL